MSVDRRSQTRRERKRTNFRRPRITRAKDLKDKTKSAVNAPERTSREDQG